MYIDFLDKEKNNEIFLNQKDYNGKYQIFIGGMASGKTFWVNNYLLNELYEENKNILILRANELMLKEQFDSVKDNIKHNNALELFNFKEFKYIENKETKSKIFFSSIQHFNYLSFKKDFDIIFIDEITELNACDFLRLNIFYKNARFILACNGFNTIHWLYKTFFCSKDKNEDVNIIYTNYRDNKFLTKEDGEWFLAVKENIGNVFFETTCMGKIKEKNKNRYFDMSKYR